MIIQTASKRVFASFCFMEIKMTAITVGKKVPNFTGTTTEGSFTLNDHLGKKVVIYFYPKDNTPGCTIESKGFRDHLADFDANNTVIVGVSRDSVKSHCKFIEKQSLNFPLISDEDESICRLFDVIKEKSMFGKKYMGIVRSTFLIDEKGILQNEWRKVSVTGHVQAVLDAASA